MRADYFHAHQFRSRAVVEYGKSIRVPFSLVDDFKKGGESMRAACSALLQIIQNALMEVTVTASDWNALQLIQAARRLYEPRTFELSAPQKMELTRRFDR